MTEFWYHSALLVQFGAIATACGIGGGPFFVPLFTYDLGFSEALPFLHHRCTPQNLTCCEGIFRNFLPQLVMQPHA